MIDKYLLDELCQRSDEKGELARWVVDCQAEVDRERRKSAALEREIYRLQGIVNTPVKLPPFGFQLNPHSNSLYFPRNDFIKAIEEHGLTVQED